MESFKIIIALVLAMFAFYGFVFSLGYAVEQNNVGLLILSVVFFGFLALAAKSLND
jgi:hypothetical protein